MTDTSYRVIVASDNSPVSRKAVHYAVDLCKKLAVPHELEVVFVVALNPLVNPVPFLGDLDRSANVGIENDAKKDLEELRGFLKQFDGVVNYKIVDIKDYTDVGPILETYAEKRAANLFVIGSRNNDGLKKLILGSTSEYCIHHVKCPVVVVKGDYNETKKTE
ncbi:hypothetical protein BC936DRAFT_142899 [Jimgerdemannia flammicorona]|uniref:Uncharacterized protein n=2 Tax=Jimgerdemannia flammicorona TaxID=994334 RepID=A0A433QSE5_9FUNG|nr:hypothetical protein BC936DRAFT_142899 [Jimgerdemannia flammicorona]RUS32703.1 hypothetical protein BC938DRAFT_474552 [Jimgerdemannia flammicorona]